LKINQISEFSLKLLKNEDEDNFFYKPGKNLIFQLMKKQEILVA
jgi:hypothetical protein